MQDIRFFPRIGGFIMRMYDLIRKKRDGERLAKEEIDWMIRSYTNGEIPDYQMSALMMAIYFRGMNEQETLNLTLAMADSGERLDLSAIHGIKVDKHSTGGVGDKTSLALVPLVASCGIPVAKMSGRGLGHTGGTIDKLESFSGFSTAIPVETFIKNVNTIGISIMGQTADLAPADKKLYALRDVTATVDNLSTDRQLDHEQETGCRCRCDRSGCQDRKRSFMKSEEDAFALAEEMVTIGKNAGRQMHALITDMDQPLGYAIGNALEVKEAIATLNGSGPEDFTELVLALGSRMLIAGKKAEDVASAEKMLRQSIQNGDALRKLEAFVKAQGGTGEEVSHPEKLPAASMQIAVPSPQSGYISHIQCDEIGVCSLLLGGGRETKDSVIDLSVGLELKKKVGDYVEKGETLAVLHANDQEKAGQAEERFLRAYRFSETQPPKRPMIFGEI